MCKTICDCEVKLTETENGYSLEVKGKDVKERLKGCFEQMKGWVEMCCSGKKSSFKEPTQCCN